MSTQIKEVKSAFEKLNLDINVKAITAEIPERFATVLEKVYHTLVASEAIRDGYIPNYNDRSEKKWEDWFDMETDANNPSGFRFHDSDYTAALTDSVLGPLLSQKTSSQADELGRIQELIFADLYKDRK
jgi:hypothetical protein